MRHEFMSRHEFPKTMPSCTLACPPSQALLNEYNCYNPASNENYDYVPKSPDQAFKDALNE